MEKNTIYNSNNSFSAPFVIGIPSGYGYTNKSVLLDNSFNYGTIHFRNVQRGESELKESSDGTRRFNRPNTDRYYGELVDFVPSEGTTASIPMKRVSFGASFMAVNSFAKTGTLEIKMTDAPKMEIDFTAGELDQFWVKDIFTFSDVAAAYADNAYTETIATTINWIREDGGTVPLGTHDITFKRNRNTIVTVLIKKGGSDSELGFEIDDDEMVDIEDMEEDEDNNTTIEDGEIVDTEVDADA